MNIERALATIRQIQEIHPIPDADAIELARIDGWQVVVKKGEFKESDWCVYIEIDSIVPEHEVFEFLRNKKFRIKTMKMRGTLSQGIAFPLSIFSLLNLPLPLNNKIDPNTGYEDVTELLGITKYEPPIPAQLAGEVRGMFPSRAIKTDENRVQNLQSTIDKLKQTHTRLVVSEKLDGTSFTAMILDNEFHVCSRNLDLKETDTNTYWVLARKLNLEEKLRNYCTLNNLEEICLQGELIGEGIQKNKYQIKGHDVRFFSLFNIRSQSYFNHSNFMHFLTESNLESVPILSDDFYLTEYDNDSLLEYADGYSQLNVNTLREGVVFRTYFDVVQPYNKVSFKVISNKFLLKNNE